MSWASDFFNGTFNPNVKRQSLPDIWLNKMPSMRHSMLAKFALFHKEKVKTKKDWVDLQSFYESPINLKYHFLSKWKTFFMHKKIII